VTQARKPVERPEVVDAAQHTGFPPLSALSINGRADSPPGRGRFVAPSISWYYSIKTSART
jgi:hypothetical protein